MVALIPPQTVLTPAGATNALQSNGLDALGLTLPNLSPAWSPAAPAAYDPLALTLQVNGLLAPFRAIREFVASPALYSGPDGASLSAPAAVLRLHPEAARRLTALVAARLGAAPPVHPIPVALVVRNVPTPSPAKVPGWIFAGDPVDVPAPATVSFHDARGLIVDPVAVACLFADLLAWRPGLAVTDGPAPSVGDPGGLTAFAALASGVLAHVVDPHGWGYAPTRDVARLRIVDAGNTTVAAIPDGAVVTIALGQTIGRSAADDAADGAVTPLRWGWATAGTLTRTALAPPILPAGVTLARQFLRVIAVDLDWHLMGNRTTGPVAAIPGDDGLTPPFLQPVVRDPVPNFAYLADAQDVAAAAAALAAGLSAQPAVFALAVSPVLDEALTAPPAPGPTAHWPAFPAVVGAAQAIGPATTPATGITAQRRSAADGPGADLDVIVTLKDGSLPNGAHVRLFPRLFQEIAAIGNTPSFVRPDGGAALVRSGTATAVLLTNAFGLPTGGVFPAPANLAVDMVVTDRMGRRKLFSKVTVPVTGTAAWPGDGGVFAGVPVLGLPSLKAVLDGLATRAVAASALFGVPGGVPAPAAGGGPLAFIRALAHEGQPRQGPRLPTMMRFESLLVTGGAAAAGTPLLWRALLTGTRLSGEARAALPEQGNPGNPAGPDVFATGIRCDGLLARDAALHAVKRAQPIIPLGGAAFGWLVETGGTNWNPPPPDTQGTVAGVFLETVAALCDSPELSVDAVPEPQPGDSVQALVNSIAGALGLPPPAITVGNEAAIRPRVQREIVTAKHGQRDALWSLQRALSDAREFIYIESPAFGRTWRAPPPIVPAPVPPPPPPVLLPHEIDLVAIIAAQLAARPCLKVVLCTPRMPDFDPSRQGWVRTAFAQRTQAVMDLSAAALTRVAAFHPVGFPGRSSPMRSTTVIVDDAWCLVGTSHVRRRGMTFDGAADIASIDRQIAKGYSAGIAQFRQGLMARKLGVSVPVVPGDATALWVRLAEPESAFGVVADLLAEGGQGRISPIWAGPTDTAVLPQHDDIADPDGAKGADFATFIAAAVSGE